MREVIIKHIINDDYDQMYLDCSLKGKNLALALQDVIQEIFRPARKHGYSDNILQKLIENSGTFKDENGIDIGIGEEIIYLLEEKFYEILTDRGIVLDDLIR